MTGPRMLSEAFIRDCALEALRRQRRRDRLEWAMTLVVVGLALFALWGRTP